MTLDFTLIENRLRVLNVTVDQLCREARISRGYWERISSGQCVAAAPVAARIMDGLERLRRREAKRVQKQTMKEMFA